MLLSAVSVLVVAQSSSEIPEGLMNNPVYYQFAVGCYVSRNCSFRRACNPGSVKLTVGWVAIHHRIQDLRGTNYARKFVFFLSSFNQIQEYYLN